MSNLSVVVIAEAVNASFQSQVEANQARWLKFCEALKNNNDGLTPNVDANNRLHSPVNGYAGIGGHIYLKGQFIPHSDTDYEGVERLKIKIQGVDFINALRENEDKAIAGCVGSTWHNIDGVLCANLYLEIASGQADMVCEAVERVQSSYKVVKVGHALDGKKALLGVVIDLWQKSSEYGVQEGFTVQTAEGAIYKGTLPKSIYSAVKGDIVTFVANFTEGSPYFKRPSKAALFEEGSKKVA